MLRNTTLNPLPVINEMATRGVQSGFTPFYVLEALVPFSKGGYGSVWFGQVYSSYGIFQAVSKTANDPNSTTEVTNVIKEGQVMLGLQAAGLVKDGCTIRALALCTQPDPTTGHVVTLLMERAQRSLMADVVSLLPPWGPAWAEWPVVVQVPTRERASPGHTAG